MASLLPLLEQIGKWVVFRFRESVISHLLKGNNTSEKWDEIPDVA
ncbi:hypothetical protein [Dokdonia sinensis]|nr:hypothetical protein [Dokdonia sinensis]